MNCADKTVVAAILGLLIGGGIAAFVAWLAAKTVRDIMERK